MKKKGKKNYENKKMGKEKEEKKHVINRLGYRFR